MAEFTLPVKSLLFTGNSICLIYLHYTAETGQTFRQWLGQLEALGYTVEWRELVAADYGAPTTRKRFFLIARSDERPIVWPEPTHAPADSQEVKEIGRAHV